MALAGLVSLGSPMLVTAQNNRAVSMIKMTGDQLRAQGIAVQLAGVTALPNSCAAVGTPGLSISNEMLAAFTVRGFTLESLCLSLTSYFRFDPETGKPMPFASLPEATVPLNLPDCFKRAAPFTDCRWNYEPFWGTHDAQEQEHYREIARAIDSIARKQITSGKSEWITAPVSDRCRTDVQINPFDVQINGRDLCIMLEKVVLSKKLPLGYGYAFHHPEGSDPDEDKIDLTTYGKKPGVVPVWSTAKPK
jgi:hypothetical protein